MGKSDWTLDEIRTAIMAVEPITDVPRWRLERFANDLWVNALTVLGHSSECDIQSLFMRDVHELQKSVSDLGRIVFESRKAGKPARDVADMDVFTTFDLTISAFRDAFLEAAVTQMVTGCGCSQGWHDPTEIPESVRSNKPPVARH